MDAAAYARYSTDRQTDNSIAYQMSKIYEYCAKNGITVTASYADEAATGTNTENRVEFLKMLAAATNKEFEAVIIYDITRGSRDVGDWFSFRKTMSRLNVKVISVEDRLGDILNPNDFLVELMNVGIGQHAVLTTRQKSIDGVAVKAKDGVFLGGYAPLGYDIENQKYVINEREAATIRIIFDMYAKGESYRAILERIKGTKGKRGKPLGGNSLNSILKNERYIGVYTWNKRHIKQMRRWAGGALNPNCVRLEDMIPPIIDTDTWERVQKRMSENKKATNKAKREYLLTGLIECDCCGATFVGHTSTNKKGYEYRTYICGNKYRTRTCKAKNANAAELEIFIIANLKQYLDDIDFEEVAGVIAEKINAATADLSKEKKELADVIGKISNGVKHLMRIDFELPELEEEIAALRLRKGELEDIIARNASNTQKLDSNKLVELFRYSAANMDEDADIKEAIKCHVERIYAHAGGSFTVNVGVHINGCGDRI